MSQPKQTISKTETKEQAANQYCTDIGASKTGPVYSAVLFGANWQSQQTSTLYTRAQMIEFGEKVKSECLLTIWNLDTPDRPRKDMESINIENLFK
jgi:hypothetical protein